LCLAFYLVYVPNPIISILYTLVKKKVVTFGEVMMRLSTPAFAKFEQANQFDVIYAGAEANVAVSLAYFGMNTYHIARLPEHRLGKTAVQSLRKHGVKDDYIQYGDGRMGVFFLETGAVSRASQIIYDRYQSAFWDIQAGDFDWETILEGADWFHWSGITPALSQGAADACLEAIQTANRLGVKVSGDIFYRSNLWNYGKTPQQIMPDLTAGCDLVLANADNFLEIYGVSKGNSFEEGCLNMRAIFPRIQYFTDTSREQVSASHNRISAKIFDGIKTYTSPTHDITHIVDRIGGGDAYVAGLLYGIMHYDNLSDAVSFAAAATSLKHTIEGDFNLCTAAEVETVMNGDGSGRLKR
jgi:2-dehydro-3-deoxygluconokinase